MAFVAQYFSYAETALAAYGANLVAGGDNSAEYIRQNMGSKEAESFDKTWLVLSQSPDNIDGFSAVLLQNRESGEKVLAIRGTEPSQWGADYVTDLYDIFAFGTVAFMSQYQSLDAYYTQLVSDGLLGAAEQVVVTGHSLGGFLTQAFVARHDAVVSAAYTFNAPGTRGGIGQVLEFMGITDASAPNSKIINVRASDGVSMTAGLGQMLGSVQQVRIEAGTANPVYYHSIATLTDTLSVYQAYAGLQPSLTVDQIGNLFVGSGVGSNKLESALDVLRTALLGPGQSSTATGDKESLFNNLYAFTDSQTYKDLAGQLTINLASLDLRARARNNFAALVALQDLSPIVVSGKDAAANAQLQSLWQATRADAYAAWQADRSSATPVTYTDEWIADRAALLQALTVRNQRDIAEGGYVDDVAAKPGQVSVFQYYGDAPAPDQTQPGLHRVITRSSGVSGLPEQFIAFGNDGDNLIEGTNNALGDHLYGGAGNDTLKGLGGDDHLEGGEGDDTLHGGAGADTLVGGTGVDTYVLEGDWGMDTLIDSDGLGSIVVDGTTLTGGKAVGQNAWQSDDGLWRYALTEAGNLIITSVDKPGRIVVQGFANLQSQQASPLGLNLPQPSTPEQPKPAEPSMYALQGGYLYPGAGPDGHIPMDSAWQLESDGSVAGKQPWYEANDLFHGPSTFPFPAPGTIRRVNGAQLDEQSNPYVTYAETYYAESENDRDVIDAGDGADYVWAGRGADYIMGGEGHDHLAGKRRSAIYSRAASACWVGARGRFFLKNRFDRKRLSPLSSSASTRPSHA